MVGKGATEEGALQSGGVLRHDVRPTDGNL